MVLRAFEEIELCGCRRRRSPCASATSCAGAKERDGKCISIVDDDSPVTRLDLLWVEGVGTARQLRIPQEYLVIVFGGRHLRFVAPAGDRPDRAANGLAAPDLQWWARKNK